MQTIKAQNARLESMKENVWEEEVKWYVTDYSRLKMSTTLGYINSRQAIVALNVFCSTDISSNLNA